MRKEWEAAMEVLIADYMRAQGRTFIDAWEVQVDVARYWRDRGRTHLPEHWMRAWRRTVKQLGLRIGITKTTQHRTNRNGRRVSLERWELERRVLAPDVAVLRAVPNWRKV